MRVPGMFKGRYTGLCKERGMRCCRFYHPLGHHQPPSTSPKQQHYLLFSYILTYLQVNNVHRKRGRVPFSTVTVIEHRWSVVKTFLPSVTRAGTPEFVLLLKVFVVMLRVRRKNKSYLLAVITLLLYFKSGSSY